MFRRLFLSKPFGFVAAAAVWNHDNSNVQTVGVDPGIHVEFSEKVHHRGRLHQSIFHYGQPLPYVTMSYSNHVVCYDLERRIPRYVAERITKEHISGKVSRQDVGQDSGGFKPDPAVDNMFSSANADFAGSGWSRGHMAAAANHKHDLTSMSDTFFLTNIVPQDNDNNSGFWNRLEWYCRGLAKRYDAVYVITGPLFIAQRKETKGKEEKRFLTVELIGRSGVHVPTHLYKAILVEKGGKPVAIAAFVVPNQPIPTGAKISDYQVPIADLERFAGMRFFHQARSLSSQIGDLCRSDDTHCRLSAEEEKRFAEFDEKRRKETRKEKVAVAA